MSRHRRALEISRRYAEGSYQRQRWEEHARALEKSERFAAVATLVASGTVMFPWQHSFQQALVRAVEAVR